MLSVSPVVKIFLYGQAADLRRGYDGLASIVQESMEQDPLAGSLFVFVNKRANRFKMLYWDETGYAIWMKRLEVGTFEIPRVGDAFRIDLERIIELKPDLVIAWKSGNPQTALQKLRRLGISVWQVEITRPEQIAGVVEDISRAADTEGIGKAVAVDKALLILARDGVIELAGSADAQ